MLLPMPMKTASRALLLVALLPPLLSAAEAPRGCTVRELNEVRLSATELAETLVECFECHPLRGRFPAFAGIRTVENAAFYGKGYQDCRHRKPSIGNAAKYCDWRPSTPFVRSVESALDFFLRQTLPEFGHA